MGYNTKIEWANHTFNPWIGCAKVSDGCKNCYAENLMDKRYGTVKWGVNGTRKRTSAANWKKPIAWNREAEAKGTRYRVFCASLADVFEDRAELIEWRLELFLLIFLTPHLDWLLLTKRPENIRRFIQLAIKDIHGGKGENYPIAFYKWLIDWDEEIHPPFNVWLGTSVENQEAADTRIHHLIDAPAVIRFLSMEPLLGQIDLHPADENGTRLYDYATWLDGGCTENIDWVIVGGESGPRARPMHPEWVRSLRDQCQAAGTPFLFKQWGEYSPDKPLKPLVGKLTAEQVKLKPFVMTKVGKHAAGRELDGREWNEVPEVLAITVTKNI